MMRAKVIDVLEHMKIALTAPAGDKLIPTLLCSPKQSSRIKLFYSAYLHTCPQEETVFQVALHSTHRTINLHNRLSPLSILNLKTALHVGVLYIMVTYCAG